MAKNGRHNGQRLKLANMTKREFEHYERSLDRRAKIICTAIATLGALAVAIVKALL